MTTQRKDPARERKVMPFRPNREIRAMIPEIMQPADDNNFNALISRLIQEELDRKLHRSDPIRTSRTLSRDPKLIHETIIGSAPADKAVPVTVKPFNKKNDNV